MAPPVAAPVYQPASLPASSLRVPRARRHSAPSCLWQAGKWHAAIVLLSAPRLMQPRQKEQQKQAQEASSLSKVRVAQRWLQHNRLCFTRSAAIIRGTPAAVRLLPLAPVCPYSLALRGGCSVPFLFFSLLLSGPFATQCLFRIHVLHARCGERRGCEAREPAPSRLHVWKGEDVGREEGRIGQVDLVTESRCRTHEYASGDEKKREENRRSG